MERVKDLFDEGRIDPYYKQFIKDTCECGSPLLMNNNLTRYRCSNLRCPNLLSVMVTNTFSKLGITGVGKKTFSKLIKENEYTSPVQVYLSKQLPYEVRCGFIDKVKQNQVTFTTAISLLSLPNLDKKSFQVFRGIRSSAHWKEVVSQWGGIDQWLLVSLGQASSTYFDLLETITEYEDEIMVIDNLFNIVEPAHHEVPLVITGEPRGTTKEEFVKELNDIGQGIYSFRLCNAIKSAPFIVADTDRPTHKYKEGVRMNKIIRSWDLRKTIEEVVRRELEREQSKL